MEKILLTLIILITIIICLSSCVTFLSKLTEIRLKISLIYATIVFTLYQIICFLYFSSSLQTSNIILFVKEFLNFYQMPAYLFCIAFFVREGKFAKTALGIHVLTLGALAIIFSFSNLRIYTIDKSPFLIVISGIFFLICEVCIICSDTWLRNRLKTCIWLFAIITLGMLWLARLESDNFYIGNLLDQSMILLIMFILTFVLIPVFGEQYRRIPVLDMIKDIEESIIVLDTYGTVKFIHNGIMGNDMINQIEKIKQEIMLKEQTLENFKEMSSSKKNEQEYEGELTLFFKRPLQYHYRVSILFSNGIPAGRIIVLRDVTQYSELIQKLSEKNMQLKEAFESQRELIEVERKLICGEEHQNILEGVNGIAEEYLNMLKEKAKIFGDMVHDRDIDLKKSLELENENMISMTRNKIEEIRSLARKLYLKA